jgi:glycosyltransferase involved in cell wall biosynthesis
MRLLHVHTRFDPLGEAMGTLMFIRALPAGVENAIVSADPITDEARTAVGGRAVFPDFAPLGGAPLPKRLHRIGAALRNYDLVLTHGWGAIDAVLAATLFGAQLGLPPVIHHEHVLDPAEARQLSRRRTWTRRVAFGRVAALVVPSPRLEAIALGPWQQPASRVRRIGPAADLAALARKPRGDVLPRLIKRPGELWLGAIGALDEDAGAGALSLVRALAPLDDAWQLVLPGEGPARDAVRAEALRLAVAHRVHMPGMLGDPVPALGLFDLFAHAGAREPFPGQVAAAMGAGLAFAAPRVGDLAELLGAGADAQLVAPDDDAAFTGLIARLADGPSACDALGEANRRTAAAFARDAVLAQFREVCAAALGRERFP